MVISQNNENNLKTTQFKMKEDYNIMSLKCS